jgi:hypothetical protein
MADTDKFGYTLRQEKMKLVTVSKASVLTKNIVTRSLMPILDSLDDIYSKAMHNVGQTWTLKLRAVMMSSAPSGKRYRIIDVDENAPRAQPGQKSQRYHESEIHGGWWQASGKKQPPAIVTESMLNSIGYQVRDGVLLVGQLIGPGGNEDSMGTELRPLFFRGVNRKDLKEGFAGRLFVSDDAEQVPVRKYSGALEHGFQNWFTEKTVKRPWFGQAMAGMRQQLKEELRKEIWAIIRKKTRSTHIQKALIVKIYMTQG